MPRITPPFCPGCGGELDGALAVCSKCIEFEQRPWLKAFAIFRLNGTARAILHRLKYSNQPEVARAFGIEGAKIISGSGIKFDAVVPVPLHWSRKLWRGYNQTALFGQVLAHTAGILYIEVLSRTKITRQQAKLSREERIKNLDGAFSLKSGRSCRGMTILLIDDVFTTGVTLSAAAKPLKADGCDKIYVMVIGRR